MKILLTFFIILNSSIAFGSYSVDEAVELLKIPLTPSHERQARRNINIAKRILDGLNDNDSKKRNALILKRLINRTENFFKIRDKLNKDCPNIDSRNLKNQFLNAASKQIGNIDETCKGLRRDIGALQEELKNLPKAYRLSKFQDLVMNDSLKLSANKYAEILKKYKLNPLFSNIESDLCGNECTNEAKSIIAKESELKYQVNQITSSNQVADDLSREIQKVNEVLDKVKADTEYALLAPTGRPVNRPDTELNYRDYVSSYAKAVGATEHGFLLQTEYFRSRVGEFRTLKDFSFFDRKGGVYSLKPHSIIRDRRNKAGTVMRGSRGQMVNAALREVQRKLSDQTRALNEMKKDKTNEERGVLIRPADKSLRDLSRLVKTNPVSVGRVLIERPDLAMDICDILLDVQNRDESDAFWDQAWMIGGLVLGVAITATGVGAGVGLWMVGASSAAAGTLMTIASGAVIAGGALGTAEAGYWGREAYQSYNEAVALDAALYTGLSDPSAISEIRSAYDEFDSSVTDAVLSGVFTVADIGAIKGTVVAADKINDARRASDLKDLSETVTGINRLSNANKLKLTEAFESIESFGNYYKQRKSEFIGTIFRASEGLRMKILEKVSTLSKGKLKELVDAALKEADRCRN